MEILIGLKSIGTICGAILIIAFYFIILWIGFKAVFEKDEIGSGIVMRILAILFLIFWIGLGADTILTAID